MRKQMIRVSPSPRSHIDVYRLAKSKIEPIDLNRHEGIFFIGAFLYHYALNARSIASCPLCVVGVANTLMNSRRDSEIPYALRAGRVVHVSEVARGRECGCVCARCGEALVARKGIHREHHFAHFRDSDCQGAAETLLHSLAKELLSNVRALALPSYTYRARVKPRFGPPVSIEREIFAASRMCISSVAVERSLGPIVPDLLFRSGEETLILEIAVSHPVDRVKLRHIRRMNIPALELSLTAEHLSLSRAELLELLVEDTSIKAWRFHPAQRSAEADWVKARRRSIASVRNRVVNYCVDAGRKGFNSVNRVTRTGVGTTTGQTGSTANMAVIRRSARHRATSGISEGDNAECRFILGRKLAESLS